MSEIKSEFYPIRNSGIYVTDDQFIWEYKWFCHGEEEEVYLIAQEFKTNRTITTPIESKSGENINSKIKSVLEEHSEMFKVMNR